MAVGGPERRRNVIILAKIRPKDVLMCEFARNFAIAGGLLPLQCDGFSGGGRPVGSDRRRGGRPGMGGWTGWRGGRARCST